MRAVVWAGVLLLGLAPGPAHGHQAGISYSELRVQGDRVEASLRVSAGEILAAPPPGGPANVAGLDGAPESGGGALALEALGSISISQAGGPCRLQPGAVQREPPDGLLVTGTFRCRHPDEPLVVRIGILERMARGHTHLAKVVAAGRVEEHALRGDRVTFEVRTFPAWWVQGARFAALGVEHIFTGYDHLAFLLGLLLLGGTLGRVVRIVTSFTVAHSATLALASLRIASLPASVVEPLIAGSIVCVAAENLLQLRRSSPHAEARRWRLGLAFGLVHGFGFAGALSELQLSKAGLAVALLSFNVGVEAGQAAVAAAVLPLFGWLRRRPGFAPAGLRAGSLAIGAAGVFWLVQRLR